MPQTQPIRLRDLLCARNPPTPSPKYPSHCISSTRTEEILEVPNSTVWLGCKSITAKSLNVSSDDGSADDALAADEEEDIATYHGGGARSASHGPDFRSERARRASERFAKARVFYSASKGGK
jgi:hypothetical protein